MKEHRSIYEMLADMLKVLPDYITSIKYKSNIQSKYFNQYFGLLLQKGLIDTLHNRCFISPKGKDYLQTLEQLLTLQSQSRDNNLSKLP